MNGGDAVGDSAGGRVFVAKVVGREAAFHWSISKIAEFLGMDRKTVNRRLEQGSLAPVGEYRGNPVYDARDVVKYVLGPAGTPDGSVNFDEFPEARLAWYRSENSRIDLEKKLGELVPETELVRCLAALAKSVSGMLDSLPDVLERDAGATPEQLAMIQASIDGLRTETAEAFLRALDEDPQDG